MNYYITPLSNSADRRWFDVVVDGPCQDQLALMLALSWLVSLPKDNGKARRNPHGRNWLPKGARTNGTKDDPKDDDSQWR